MGRRGIGCTLERRVATPFSRTGQIYRSGPAIRSLVFGIPGLNGARSPSRRLRGTLGAHELIGDSLPFSPPPPSPIRYSFFRIFLHRPNPLLCPTQRQRWNSRGTPRQRSHCFSLNNTSAIFELRCQREQRYRIRSATVLRRPNTTTSPENAGRETRERERGTNQHYPAIKRRLLSTVRSFFSSQVALPSWPRCRSRILLSFFLR